MAVRLTCLTEAGGRGPFMSAGEINIIGTTRTAADPATIGEWAPLIRFPLVPVAAAALPGSRVCLFVVHRWHQEWQRWARCNALLPLPRPSCAALLADSPAPLHVSQRWAGSIAPCAEVVLVCNAQPCRHGRLRPS